VSFVRCPGCIKWTVSQSLLLIVVIVCWPGVALPSCWVVICLTVIVRPSGHYSIWRCCRWAKIKSMKPMKKDLHKHSQAPPFFVQQYSLIFLPFLISRNGCANFYRFTAKSDKSVHFSNAPLLVALTGKSHKRVPFANSGCIVDNCNEK